MLCKEHISHQTLPRRDVGPNSSASNFEVGGMLNGKLSMKPSRPNQVRPLKYRLLRLCLVPWSISCMRSTKKMRRNEENENNKKAGKRRQKTLRRPWQPRPPILLDAQTRLYKPLRIEVKGKPLKPGNNRSRSRPPYKKRTNPWRCLKRERRTLSSPFFSEAFIWHSLF